MLLGRNHGPAALGHFPHYLFIHWLDCRYIDYPYGDTAFQFFGCLQGHSCHISRCKQGNVGSMLQYPRHTDFKPRPLFCHIGIVIAVQAEITWSLHLCNCLYCFPCFICIRRTDDRHVRHGTEDSHILHALVRGAVPKIRQA